MKRRILGIGGATQWLMLALLFSLLFILHFHRIAVTAIVMTAAFAVDAFSFRFYHFAPEDRPLAKFPSGQYHSIFHLRCLAASPTGGSRSSACSACFWNC